MAQVGIHNNDEIPVGMFDSMDIGRAQAEFSLAWSQQNLVFTINGLQLFGCIQCSIWAAIINHDNFIV